ncbi:MAG: serine/threonine protein kinase [Planctomycetes bacterium]|nr:serine/threonine protein kinase [Planctomycetota bacterium]
MTENGTSDRQEPADTHLRPLPKVGQELGKFIIERELPRGGQARVFRAWQTDLTRPVALKILPPSFASDEDALMRFRREVENVARISHPNIVRIFEAGELEGYPYFTMEYLDGDDCETLLRRGPLNPDDAASIMEAIARAVAEAHKKGIIHRDLKPGNVIVRENNTPVLTDFGLAQDVTQSAQLTQTGVSMGTPAYMSPEQARGERHRVGKKSDIYSLGATLFTLLTGKRPVEGASAYEAMLKAAAMQGPAWPRETADKIPADLRAIVETAMQNDPAKRYESAQAMAEDLERFLRGDWVSARSRGWVSKALYRVRRYAAVAAVIAISAGLSAGLIISSLDNNNPANRTQRFLPEPTIWPDATADNSNAAQSLTDKWTLQGAVLERATGSERLYTRSAQAPISLAYREPICWGDFELETQFAAQDAVGEIGLLVGVPEDGGEPAYRIVIGAHAQNRFEIRRLGKAVTAGYMAAMPTQAGLRALITRAGESLRFELRSAAGDNLLALASLDDAWPALNGGRDRFAISADCRSLLVRGVSVRHRDDEYSRETVLFLEGSYASARAPLVARLAAPTDPERKSERAQLHFMFGRCLEKQAEEEPVRTEELLGAALAEYSEAKRLAQEARLRGRVFLQSALVEARLGRDGNALVQLAAARNNADAQNDLSSQVHLRTLEFALALALSPAKDEPVRQSNLRRALAYLDWICENNLRDALAVGQSHLEAARLRLALAAASPEETQVREQALANLRWIMNGPYQGFGRVYGPALALLFEQRRLEFEIEPALPSADNTATPAAEMLEIAARMAQGANRYAASFDDIRQPLVAASWLARLSGQNEAAQEWLLLCQANSKGDDALWIRAQLLLLAEERQQGDLTGRENAWLDFNAACRKAERTPEAEALLALSDFWADMNRESSRRALEEWLKRVPRHWYAYAAPREFSDYLVGIRLAPVRRADSVKRLEALAASTSSGWFGLLRNRAATWLPAENPNG